MKIELIHKILELNFPFLNLLGILTIKLLRLVIGADEFDACWCAKYLLLRFVLGPDDLKNSIEGDHESPLVGFVINRMIEHSFWRED